MNKSSKVLIILLSIIVIILSVVAVHFALKSSNISGNNADNNVIEITNEDEIKTINDSLNYLIYNHDSELSERWRYVETNFYTLSNSTKMSNVMYKLYDGDSPSVISSSKIHFAYQQLFGPDEAYVDASFSIYSGCSTYKYDGTQYVLEDIIPCGTSSFEEILIYDKLYKMERDNNTINVYYYVQPYVLVPNMEGLEYYIYLKPDYLSMNDNYLSGTMYGSEDTITDYIEQMIENNQVHTYKYIFKKQSDGKYYFYSSNWIN